MALKGDIKEFSLIDVIQLISQSSKSGILIITLDNMTVKIYFKDGKLVDVKGEGEEFSFKIGNYLVSKGVITEEELKMYLEKQKKVPIRIGQILVDEGKITNEELKRFYREHIKEKFSKILSLESGKYEFIQTIVDYNPDEIEPISIDTILLDLLKNIDEIKLFKKKIKNIGFIYKKTYKDLTLEVDENLTAEEPIKIEKDKILMSKDASKIYMLIDGQNSISEIISKTALDEYTVLKIIFLLSEKNLIEITDQQKLSLERKPQRKKLAICIFIMIFLLLSLIYSLLVNNIFQNIAFFKVDFDNYYSKNLNDYEKKLKDIAKIYFNSEEKYDILYLFFRKVKDNE